jgi:RNA polymerase sigma-70 factor (sigma-E family)
MEFDAGTAPRAGLSAAQPGAPAHAGGRRARPDDAGEYARSAVAALYAEHALSLVRLAHIILGNPAAAEDVVQEAFCGLYRRWPHLNDHAKALGYVRSSVINGCRTVQRRGATIELEDAHQRPAASAEAALLTDEERREVIRAIRDLPSRQREVLTLRFFLDLPDDQIAEALGIGKGTVRSSAHRGLISLRRALGETS